MVQRHVLLLTFPAQGHINPALQFSKRLTDIGVQVTLATSVFVLRRLSGKPTPDGLKFAAFSDGYDDGFTMDQDVNNYMSLLRRNSSQAVRDIVAASAGEGNPVTCLIYTLFLPWAAVVAREEHVPSFCLWVQPATMLGIYYNYFNGYEEVISDNINDPSWSIKLPNLPLSFTGRDLPNFFLPQNFEIDAFKFALPTFKEHLVILDGETNPKVLVNTFDALEPDALKAMDKYKLIAIGPLISFEDDTLRGDLFQKSKDYTDWLNSRPDASVIYLSFGSLTELTSQQVDEIARGLIECQRPFLWVIREKSKGLEGEEGNGNLIRYEEELGKIGMIVPWCSQLEVLSHPSLGCFVTHSGWNSTLESLASGVPTVAFPRWMDQLTNAKLIEDIWETGVRVRENREGIVEGSEIKRCVEMVMGEEGFGRRENAKKWKELAKKAVEDGGSSAVNLKAFMEEIGSHDQEPHQVQKFIG